MGVDDVTVATASLTVQEKCSGVALVSASSLTLTKVKESATLPPNQPASPSGQVKVNPESM